MILEPVREGTRIHRQAARSTFWEREASVVDPAFEKEAWLATTLLSFGQCGFTVGEDATILFCSREDAAGAAKLPTAPISEDAEIITSLFVKAHLMGRGIEAVLVDAAIMHLTNRGSAAVEAFGYYGDPAAAADFLGHKPAYIGLMSYETLRSAGFEVAADHPVLPRLRLELPPEHDMLSAAAAEDLLARALA